MKAILPLKAYQIAILATALGALVASGFLFSKFLAHGNVSGRARIIAEQMQHESGFRYKWRVPINLQGSPWYRSEVRILEDDKPLPLRVEDPEAVSKQGNGRFGVSPFSIGEEQKEYVWFSASDGTDPATNGRKYEFEMRRTTYRFAILSACLLACSIIAFLIVLLPGICTPITKCLVAHARDLRLSLRHLAVLLLILAVGVLTQAWQRTRLVILLPLQAARLIQTENQFFYRLPSWVREGAASQFGALYEDGRPMKRSVQSDSESKDGRESYYFVSDGLVRVYFRTQDGSNAALNGRAYALKVPVFPCDLAMRLAGLLVLIGSILLICVPISTATYHFTTVSRFSQWLVSTGWRWAIVLVGLAKLWMVAGDEILAQNLDAHNYALDAMATGWPSGPPWHASGFPAIAGVVARFGIPWRLAVEVLYLAACSFLAVEIISLLSSRVIAIVLFTAMAWHPSTLSAFHLFMSDPLVLVISVALISIMFRILGKPTNEWTWPLFVATGIIAFFWEWSRTEEALVYGTLALFAGLALTLSRCEANSVSLRKKVRLCVLPFIVVLLLSTGVRIANYLDYGIFAKSRMSASGITALMKALYQIKPERDLRYAPVTHSSLQKACEASPTLRPFESALLDTNRGEVRIGEVMTKAPGEFGGGLIWVLINSLPLDSPQGNQVMLAAASEINEALRDGRLPMRHAYYPLDPNWRLWLPDLVPSFVDCLRIASSIERWPSWESAMDTNSPYLERDFDEAANRRTANAYSTDLLVEGSLSSPLPSIDSVALADQAGRLLAASPTGSNRFETHSVFYLRSALPKESMGLKLLFFQNGKCRLTDQGHTSSWWITNQNTTLSNRAILSDTGEKIDYSYKMTVAESQKGRLIESWEPRTESLCKGLSWGAVLATLLVVVFGERWNKDRFRRVLSCLALVAGWLVGRAMLYALIDSTAAFDTYRYMGCVSPLFVLILVLATAVAASLLKSLLHKTNKAESKIS